MLGQILRLIWLLPLVGCSDSRSSDTKPFSISAEASLSGDGQGVLAARISAESGYHFNEEYPTHFIPESSEQVTFAQRRFDLRPQLALTPCRGQSEDHCEARAAIPFRATAARDGHVSGVLGFSVCNPERCLIEKAPLHVALGSGETPR